VNKQNLKEVEKMKANYKHESTPKILAINVSGERFETIGKIAAKFSAQCIESSDVQKSVAELLGERTASSADSGKYPDTDTECLLFAGFNKTTLGRLLDELKSQNANVTLKAMYTPINREWSAAHLICELGEEHKRMTGGERNG
jgi:hypothetical protein